MSVALFAGLVVLLAALSLSWAMTAKTLPVIEEMIPVEVVDISDVPAVTEEPKPSIDAAPQETIEAEAPEPEPEAVGTASSLEERVARLEQAVRMLEERLGPSRLDSA